MRLSALSTRRDLDAKLGAGPVAIAILPRDVTCLGPASGCERLKACTGRKRSEAPRMGPSR